MAETCQDYQLSACIEACKMKCRDIEIRPFVNPTGLLRVPFTECVETCEESCQKTDGALNQDLKTQKQPLAYFVLKNRGEIGCTLQKEPLSWWKRLWVIFFSWLLEGLGLIEKPELIPVEVVKSPAAVPPNPTPEAEQTRPSQVSQPTSALNRKILQKLDFPPYTSPPSSHEKGAPVKEKPSLEEGKGELLPL